MIAVKSPANTPSISGSCMAGRQLICGKEDSNVWQVNPPSTKISQTSAFKSRKTTIKFGLLYQLEDFESSLISLHFMMGTLHIVLLDLANHRVVQYMDIENVRLFAFGKNILEVLLEDNKIERYQILSLQQRYKSIVQQAMWDDAVAMIVAHTSLQKFDYIQLLHTALRDQNTEKLDAIFSQGEDEFSQIIQKLNSAAEEITNDETLSQTD